MHKNNFDFLRLIFAVFVIITHAYPLTGIEECDWLCQITNGQINLSYIGVRGFFIISGFLIFQSLINSKDIEGYYWRRILRLFPALFVALALTVILGPFFYQSDVPYLQNKSVWTYLPSNLTLYKLQYSISGIFENNPFPAEINSSLWTISYEFTYYIIISLFFWFRKNNWAQILTGVLFLLLLAVDFTVKYKLNRLYYFVDLGVYFMGGSFLASIRFDILNKPTRIITIGSALLLIIGTYFGLFNYFKILLIPTIIYFGLSSTRFLSDISSKIGDMSYGIYIYSFPVQQTLVCYFRPNYIELMIYTTIIASILGYLSWHLIEKRALLLKKQPPSVLFRRQFINK